MQDDAGQDARRREIGAAIRTARRGQAITIESLAEAADLPPAELVHLENGSGALEAIALLRIAIALSIPPRRLYATGAGADPKLDRMLGHSDALWSVVAAVREGEA